MYVIIFVVIISYKFYRKAKKNFKLELNKIMKDIYIGIIVLYTRSS